MRVKENFERTDFKSVKGVKKSRIVFEDDSFVEVTQTRPHRLTKISGNGRMTHDSMTHLLKYLNASLMLDNIEKTTSYISIRK